MLPAAHWWALREKFKQSIPGTVSLTYIASALGMQEGSARSNVFPYLRQLGLIDADGRTQELARAWRDDTQYSEVCRKMREQVYPEELRSVAPDPFNDKSSAERWFGNATGSGAVGVRKMVAFYIILCEADVLKKPEFSFPPKTIKKDVPKEKTDNPKSKTPPVLQTPQLNQEQPPATHPAHPRLPSHPEISINLQIQISPDATPEQIDKIFESMAKHIYKG